VNSKGYRVACLSRDCLYYTNAGGPEEVLCGHPEKSRFRGNVACPLYQYDWMKRLEALGKAAASPTPSRPKQPALHGDEVKK